METKKAQFSEAGQDMLIDTTAAQLAIEAAEGFVFDELDRLASQVALPVREQYAASDQRRLAIEARWGEPHNTAWYIGLIAIA